MPVKQAGLSLPDPTLTSHESWKASCFITGKLVAELRGQEDFRTAEHAAFLREGRKEVQKRYARRPEEALADSLEGAPVQVARHLRRVKNTGKWITIQSSTVNRMEMGAHEWRDALFLKYGLEPPDLLKFCDGFNATFPICHALECNKGGLVTAHHNEICAGVADLAGKAFMPTHVCKDLLIFEVHAVQRPKDHPSGTTPSPSTTKIRGHGTEGRPSDP